MRLPTSLDEAVELAIGSQEPTGSEASKTAAGFVWSSLELERPIGHVVFLLLGQSGTGKTATIRKLFEVDPSFFPVGFGESITAIPVEATCQLDLGEIVMPLSVIDTPGLLDTGGATKDVEHGASIGFCLQNHPALKAQHITKEARRILKRLQAHQAVNISVDRVTANSFKPYPNVVMLVLSATDTRVAGPESVLSKFARVVDNNFGYSKDVFRLIDAKRPNLLVVATMAMSLGTKKGVYERKTKEFAEQVNKVLQPMLHFSVPVVFVENRPEDYLNEGEIDGEGQFLMPDGTEAPRHLFRQIVDVLEGSRDAGTEAPRHLFRHVVDMLQGRDRLSDIAAKAVTGRLYSHGSTVTFTCKNWEPLVAASPDAAMRVAVVHGMHEGGHAADDVNGAEISKEIDRLGYRGETYEQLKHLIYSKGYRSLRDLRGASISTLSSPNAPRLEYGVRRLLLSELEMADDADARVYSGVKSSVGLGFSLLSGKPLSSVRAVSLSAENPAKLIAVQDTFHQVYDQMEVIEEDRCYSRSVTCDTQSDYSQEFASSVGAHVEAGFFVNVSSGGKWCRTFSDSESESSHQFEFLYVVQTHTVDLVANCAIHPELMPVLKKLPTCFDNSTLEAFKTFFCTYGGFYVAKAALCGVLQGHFTARSSSSFVEAKRAIEAAVNVSFLSLAGAGASYELQDGEQISMRHAMDVAEMTAIGGSFTPCQFKDLDSRKLQEWTASVRACPVAIPYEMQVQRLVKLMENDVSLRDQAKALGSATDALIHGAFYSPPPERKTRREEGQRVTADAVQQATHTGRGCFPADALVHRKDGSVVAIAALNIGDVVLAATRSRGDEVRLEWSEFIGHCHANAEALCSFVEIQTIGATVAMTEQHLVHVPSACSLDGLLPARDLRPHVHRIFVSSVPQSTSCAWGPVQAEVQEVLNVRVVVRRGFFAPQTRSGSVILDGVVASCYSDLPACLLSAASALPWPLPSLIRLRSLLIPFAFYPLHVEAALRAYLHRYRLCSRSLSISSDGLTHWHSLLLSAFHALLSSPTHSNPPLKA